MNMLMFDPIRAMSHEVVTSGNFAIPPKLWKRSEAVVRLEQRGKAGNRAKQEKNYIKAR